MFLKSIRYALTLWYSVTLAVILVLFSAFLYVSLRNQLYKEVDRGLLSIAEAMANPVFEPFLQSPSSSIDQVLEDFIGSRMGGKYVQLVDGDGKPLAATRNLLDRSLPVSREALVNARNGRPTFETYAEARPYPIRVLSYPLFVRHRLHIIAQVGTSLVGTSDILYKIELLFLISIPASLLVLSYGGWFLAGRALKPVDLITKSARKISAENLSHRLEVVNPNDEIGRLAETFNDTLARLENSFARTRRFSADVSHELRTPLTILRGEIEVGLRWMKEPDEFRELLQSNFEEVNRMSRIIESLLELSRAEEEPLGPDCPEVDLTELLAGLTKQATGLAAEKGLSITFEGESPAVVRGDLLRLRQLFLNLLDNALKYTPGGGEIKVSIGSKEGFARVLVADSGQGIPAEDVPYIFDRFYRVDKARNRADGGSGLGLALVKSFVESHGGTVEVESEAGKGSVFCVCLPLAPGR